MQPEDLDAAATAAPNLILLPGAWPPDASDAQLQHSDLNVLGLGLVQRTVLAARRAGYGQIFFFGPDHAAAPGSSAVADWSQLVDALVPFQHASLIIAP